MTLTDLTPEVFEKFLHARAEARYVSTLTEHGLTPLLEYLEELGSVYETGPAHNAGGGA